MNKYQATFADGTTVTRKTEHAYAVAWRSTFVSKHSGKVCGATGFSASADKVSPFRPTIASVSRQSSSNERARAKAKNAQHLIDIGFKVEIVPAVLVA